MIRDNDRGRAVLHRQQRIVRRQYAFDYDRQLRDALQPRNVLPRERLVEQRGGVVGQTGRVAGRLAHVGQFVDDKVGQLQVGRQTKFVAHVGETSAEERRVDSDHKCLEAGFLHALNQPLRHFAVLRTSHVCG